MASNALVRTTGSPAPHTGEVRKLSTLLEASQVLLREPSLRPALEGVLDILHRHHGAIRSTVVLLNATSGEVELEAAAGDVDASRRVRYRPGEGVTGQVLATGTPSVSTGQPRADIPNRAATRPSSRARSSATSLCDRDDGETVRLGIDLAFAGSRLPAHREVPWRRRLDDRARGQGPPVDRRRPPEA
jgi:Nif-specific regulatory protein